MKHKPHTKEWLADTRNRAGLTMAQLADLAGVHVITVMNIETGRRSGSPRTWRKLDRALYGYVPAAFVDEDVLIDMARAYEASAHREGDQCWLSYAAGCEGIAFTDVRPLRGDEPAVSHVALSWGDAIKLLELQKAAFEDK